MRNKLIITLLIANAFIWGVFLPSNAKANDYNTAVIGHVITNANEIDKQALLESEMAKIGHKYALEMASRLGFDRLIHVGDFTKDKLPIDDASVDFLD